ncbi:MAG: PrsW family glutamic-type intramembrane protease [Cyclobacteriaceae bacterium]|nr:PrsW family glutamic-type intramembrane protease [Cyclobacteriaceae bacterium]
MLLSITLNTVIAFATAPGFAIALFIYLMDKHEREPIRLLILSFFYGILSVALTLFITSVIEQFIPAFENILIDEFIHAFFAVAFVEEFSKYAFLILLLYPLKDFNEPFDGIVYAVMIKMGFATLENIMYSINGGIDVAILRMFTAVPAHGSFAIIMGYFVGIAKFKHKNRLFGLIGLLSATIMHGFYDYFIFISHIPGVIVGSLISLIVGIILSLNAIRIHSDASPFRKRILRRKKQNG